MGGYPWGEIAGTEALVIMAIGAVIGAVVIGLIVWVF